MLRNHFHVSVRTKSEQEILETLRVSFVNSRQGRPSYSSNQEEGQVGKPLGSESLGSRYISDQFSNFFNSYAKTINKAYGRTGSLFQHPFGRVPITSDRQFWNVIAYIHQNPQKHQFVEDFRDWKYSSYGILLSEKRTSVNRGKVMEWFGTTEDYLSLHNQWVTDAQANWFAEDDFD